MSKNHLIGRHSGGLPKRQEVNKLAKIVIMNHPLIQHKLTYLRDKTISAKDFRQLMDEISTLMAYEVTRGLPTKTTHVKTLLGKAKGKIIPGKMMGVIAILRAGLGMVDGILKLVPGAKVGHIGLFRDPETLRPVQYFSKLPSDIPKRFLIVVDPMLATGYSAVEAINVLKRTGAKRVVLMCILAAPEGLKVMKKHHPNVDIYTCSVDKRLNKHAYIVPGLGDAGDRLFGTK